MSSSITFQVPQPSEVDCEAAIVGALFYGPEWFASVEDLRANDFYSEALGLIFQAALDLHEEGEPIDEFTVAAKVGAGNRLAPSVQEWFTKLAVGIPDASGIVSWVGLVRGASQARKAALASMELSRQIAARGSLPEALAKHAARIEVIRDALPAARDTWIRLADVSSESELLAPYSAAQLDAQVKINIPPLDESGIFGPESFNLIVARMGVGKTALGLQLAAHNAISRGIPAGYISLEMPKVDLVQRLIASRSEINYLKIRTRQLESFEREQCSYAYRDIRTAPLYFDDRPALSPGQIGLAIRRLKREHADARVFVIDYISLIELPAGDARERHDQRLAKVAEGLKNLARSLGDVTITLLCQLSRRGDQEGREPILADISDSDGIAKPANAVLAIHREYSKDDPGTRKQDGCITLLKNRDGPQIRCRVRFAGAFQHFRHLTGQEADHDR